MNNFLPAAMGRKGAAVLFSCRGSKCVCVREGGDRGEAASQPANPFACLLSFPPGQPYFPPLLLPPHSAQIPTPPTHSPRASDAPNTPAHFLSRHQPQPPSDMDGYCGRDGWKRGRGKKSDWSLRGSKKKSFKSLTQSCCVALSAIPF